MPYEVTAPELNVLQAVGQHEDKDGTVYGFDHVSNVWKSGDILTDDEVSPVVVALYDAGDEHTRSVLKRIEDKPGRKGGRSKAIEAVEALEEDSE